MKNREDQDRRTDRFAVPQGEVKLILSFEEAFFLCFVFGCLLVHDSQNNPLNIDQLVFICKKLCYIVMFTVTC